MGTALEENAATFNRKNTKRKVQRLACFRGRRSSKGYTVELFI